MPIGVALLRIALLLHARLRRLLIASLAERPLFVTAVDVAALLHVRLLGLLLALTLALRTLLVAIRLLHVRLRLLLVALVALLLTLRPLLVAIRLLLRTRLLRLLLVTLQIDRTALPHRHLHLLTRELPDALACRRPGVAAMPLALTCQNLTAGLDRRDRRPHDLPRFDALDAPS